MEIITGAVFVFLVVFNLIVFVNDTIWYKENWLVIIAFDTLIYLTYVHIVNLFSIFLLDCCSIVL